MTERAQVVDGGEPGRGTDWGRGIWGSGESDDDKCQLRATLTVEGGTGDREERGPRMVAAGELHRAPGTNQTWRCRSAEGGGGENRDLGEW